MKILFVSHTAPGGVFRVGSHHLAQQMSALGHDVVHLSTPQSILHRVKSFAVKRSQSTREVWQDTSGVVNIVPKVRVPSQLWLSKAHIVALLELVDFRDPDLVFLDQPLMAELATCFGKGTVMVYRPTDLYVRGVARRRQSRLFPRLDAVIATSEPVLRDLESAGLGADIPTLVIENGVEVTRFAVRKGTDRSGYIYVGAVDHRFDWEAVKAMADTVPAETFRIYGPRPKRVPPLPSNVKLMGPVRYEKLPGLLTSARVGILPLSDSKENAGRSPMKFYEYLASGLFVLTRSTPEIERRNAPGVFCYEHQGQLRKILRASPFDAGTNSAGRDYALGHDWRNKATSILKFCEGVANAK